MIFQRPLQPKPAPRRQDNGMQRALARARSWAGTPTACQFCNQVRGAASTLIGPPKAR